MRREDKLWNGYRLIQDDRFFKLGQDSIMLSAFVSPPNRAKIADLGCGNGALGVLLCERMPNISVTGIEIQLEVAALAYQNAELNGLLDRMEIVCKDIRNYKMMYDTGAFDYVVCNPPYFARNSGYKADGKNRSTARQETEGTTEDFIRAAAYLVKFGGRAAFVHRPERLCECIAMLQKYGLEPKRMRFVHQNVNKEPSAVLIETRRGSAPGVTIMPPMIICGEDGRHTDEYNRIYHTDQFVYE